MENEIGLLQFLICKEFRQTHQDFYQADSIFGNLYVKTFPYRFEQMYAVTCWRKDKRFHKEVLEFSTDYGASVKSPHMDIEPVTDSVLFRWHKHLFPSQLVIERPTTLSIKVILDWKPLWQTYVMIEAAP